MRRCLPRVLALPVTAGVLVLSALAPAPAVGQTVPTTPKPEPADENQAPITSPPTPVPKGKAIGRAGTALGVLRLAPKAVPTSSVLPGAEEHLPEQSALEGGFGISRAEANSESYLTYERAIAQASPVGLSVGGHAPTVPGSVVQTALPDNEKPVSTGINAPDNPLLDISALNGSAHARWSATEGPCVGTIADASTSAASLSVLDVIPTMPDTNSILSRSGEPTTGEPTTSGEPAGEGDELATALAELPGPLAHLGGLLSGGAGEPRSDGTGALLSVPNALSTRSVVRLVDIPGSERKAVESVSTMQASEINILKGTPLGLTIKVVSQPTLRVVSTGDAESSTVEYTAPVLAVQRGGRTLFELDAADPTGEIPVGVPLPGLEEVPGFADVKNVPVIGGVAELVDGGIKKLSERASEFVLDVGVLRLGIAELDESASTVSEPFDGHHLSAVARMLDVRVLPTKGLKEILPRDMADRLPSSLAQISLGEQVATAYAPKGGVECGSVTPPPQAPPAGGDQPAGPAQLAHTSAAYSSVPLFWTGTAMLLIGVVLVAGLPHRTPRGPAPTPARPSPRPRKD